MNFIAIIKKDGFGWETPFSRARFLSWAKDNIGKRVKIEPTDAISQEARGYFEGAIVPTFAEWQGADISDPDEIDAWREELKKEFNGRLIKKRDGSFDKVGMSTTKLNNKEFGEFLLKVTTWFSEQQISVPSPEIYKLWKDTVADDGIDFRDWLFDKGININGEKL